ncbi:hypothetical protein ACWEQL_15030 [Kitasatospora sp. NPDC004240]
MAGPRPLAPAELERLRWTGRPEGCAPEAPHVQVAEVVRRVLRGGGRAPAVRTKVPADLPVVIADGRRLETALAGLVDHAIRRSPAGAKVLLRADVVTGRGRGPGGGDGPGREASGGGASGGRAGGGAGGGGRARVEIRVVDRGGDTAPRARPWSLAGAGAGGSAGPAAGLVRAAGGRLTAEATPGGGLTLMLVLAVASH